MGRRWEDWVKRDLKELEENGEQQQKIGVGDREHSERKVRKEKIRSRNKFLISYQKLCQYENFDGFV